MSSSWAGWLDDGAQFPPPGRVRVSLDEAKAVLVHHPKFQRSRTRAKIWDGLERYWATFLRVQEMNAPVLGDRDIVQAMWLGGSFVSSKLDPNNLDLSVLLDGESRDAIKGKPGSGWITGAFQRESIGREYLLSPLEVPYRPVVSPFKTNELTPTDYRYLSARGAWDDWWQRCRTPGVTPGGPTVDTVKTVRGYVEVTL
ncbi:hypothetical protein OO014_04265 [Intrasporangium calvum]|uniref:Uncharacterized protein n=1 Tax=Intrasporangium calvum TaxID=53358 RepID=A0ABT5GEZ5_9MICO|nr:hypothetical protein [Intrasporangium calvum]MDC5696461.1 hypothetical protein [Intrasporangium calvum]